ncbi:MAG: hypothetical protein EOO61_18975, partial [Hymenobacter sp.]
MSQKKNGSSLPVSGTGILQPLPNLKTTTHSTFLQFILRKPNRKYLLIGLAASIVYFIILRMLYPIPSCYSDSFTYLQVAQDNAEVSFRPVEYSKIIRLFKGFST